jgi:GPI mannosyltransferase 1 subunit M
VKGSAKRANDELKCRYTPLLAFLLLPNIWLHPACGKVIFSAADVAVVLLIKQYISTNLVGSRGGSKSVSSATFAAWAAAAWLFNPYTATISTRGNGDSIVVLLQLLVLVLLSPPQVAVRSAAKDQPPNRLPWTCLASAGAFFGLLVHWRIFPVIYGPSLLVYFAHQARQVRILYCLNHCGPCLMRQSYCHCRTRNLPLPLPPFSSPVLYSVSRVVWVDSSEAKLTVLWDLQTRRPLCGWLRSCLAFGAPALATFAVLCGASYAAYGHDFLHEAILYHSTRRDPRHNFSPHFLFTYLDTVRLSGTEGAAAVPAWLDPSAGALVCMAATLVGAAAVLSDNLAAAWTVSTIVFVALNKVSTAQYFVWYMGLAPVLLPVLWRRWGKLQSFATAAWVCTQLVWLGVAYQLEFEVRTQPVRVSCATHHMPASN